MSQKPWVPPSSAEIKKRWKECVDDMLSLRRNYWLNHSYFMGEQWLSWDDTTASVRVLEFGSDADADDRCTINKFKPAAMSLLARSTKTPLGFEPRPHGVDQEALRKASLERQVLEVTAHDDDWEQVRTDEILATLMGGVSAVSVEPSAWELDDNEVAVMETGEEMRLPSQPKVKVTALSALEFGIEPGTRQGTDATYWIRCTTLTPRQAQDRYNLDEPPQPDADSASASVMQQALSSKRSGAGVAASKACLVYIYYERPTSRSPGCVMHVVGDKVVQSDPWPFTFKDRLNLSLFIQTPVGGTWKGETIFNDARQLQRNYNRAWTSVNRHIGKADNARLVMPMGATIDDDDLTGDVGEMIRVDPSIGGEPHWMIPPSIPRWLREHIEKIEAELDDLFSRHAVSQGKAPGDRNSGTALAILAEKDETPLGPMAANQQRGWQRVAEMVLSTMKHLMSQVDSVGGQFGLPPMQVKAVKMNADDQPEEVVWSAADLPDDPVVHIPLDSVMPRSQVALQDMMIRLGAAFPQLFAGFKPQQIARMLSVPDVTAFGTISDSQLALATWENSRMIAGGGENEVMVDDWHDHAKHVDQHNELRATSAYRAASPATQHFIDTHIDAHKQLAMQAAQAAQMQQAQMSAPNQPPQGQPPTDQGVAA